MREYVPGTREDIGLTQKQVAQKALNMYIEHAVLFLARLDREDIPVDCEEDES
jgi:hypothetical protein